MSVREVNMHELKGSTVMALEPPVLYQMAQRREAEIIHTFGARVSHGSDHTGSLLLLG